MLLDIRRFVRNCDVYGRNKAWRDKKQGFLKPLPIPSPIWSEISIDFVVDLPENERCKNFLVITDKLGKGVILEPCDSMDAEAVSEIFIRKFYRQHGLPAIIASDRGRQFVNILWKRICKILGIERRLSTAYHPQTDGATERMNQTAETSLRTYIDFDQRNWVRLLPIAELAINNKDAVSTGVSPFFLSHGYHVKILETDEELHAAGNEIRSPIQKADNIFTKLKQTSDWAQTAMVVAQQEQQQYADKTRAQAPKYKVGDKVWLTLEDIATATESKKLDAKQVKYTILEDMGSHNFRLDTPPGIRNVFHVDRLRAASADCLLSQISDDSHPGPKIIGKEDGTHESDVERILKKRKRGRGYKYLVKWKDYVRLTREPASIMENTVALDEFEANLNEGGGNVMG